MPKKKKQPKAWLFFSGMSMQMAITITGSVFLGIWLDQTFTNSSRIFTIIFALLGIFIALTQVITSLKKFK